MNQKKSDRDVRDIILIVTCVDRQDVRYRVAKGPGANGDWVIERQPNRTGNWDAIGSSDNLMSMIHAAMRAAGRPITGRKRT